MARISTALEEQPLDVPVLLGRASHPDAGGVGSFVGTVRAIPSESAPDRAVVALDYDAYGPLAERRLASIARRAADRWELEAVVAHHRVGHCGLGDPTIVVACSAVHRAEALDACRWVIDEVKATVPIFKKEIYADGSAWVGMEGESFSRIR